MKSDIKYKKSVTKRFEKTERYREERKTLRLTYIKSFEL